MPSLRRAFSSPSVRVSPYPALPSSRSHRAHPHGHRRSSGSDVSDRKVLADIDWWRVADGQRERGGEEEDEEEGQGEERDAVGEENPTPADSADAEAMAIASRNDDAIPAPPITDRGESATGVEPERPSTPVASQSPPSEGDNHDIFGFSFQAHVFGQSASESSFALRPRTPTRRRNASESSTSSVDSTPDSEVLRTPIERPSFAGMGFADPGPESPLFHVGLASLNTVPLVPKYDFFGQQLGGVDLNDDKIKILPDPLMCHDDLFA